MIDITEIQDTPSASEFIVPADVIDAATPKITTQGDIEVEAVAEPVSDAEQTSEQTAADKAAAKEAFRRRKAEREVSATAQELAELRAQVRDLSIAREAAQSSPAAEAPKRPNPADYDLGRWDAKYETDLSAYLDAREQHILTQAEAKAFEATRELTDRASRSQELHSLEQTAHAVGEKGVAKYPDFEESVQDALEAMPPAPEALKELVQLPNAEDVFYHLAQHPDELDKITALTPMGQALEFGKISARLASKAKVVQNVTQAKPSPQQPRGESGKFTSQGDANYDKLLKASRNPWK